MTAIGEGRSVGGSGLTDVRYRPKADGRLRQSVLAMRPNTTTSTMPGVRSCAAIVGPADGSHETVARRVSVTNNQATQPARRNTKRWNLSAPWSHSHSGISAKVTNIKLHDSVSNTSPISSPIPATGSEELEYTSVR